MTDVVFIVGVVVFFITVWGTVMAGGMVLTRSHIEQDPELRKRVDGEQLKKRLPVHLEY